MKEVFQDWKSNDKNLKSQVILLFYRIAHLGTSGKASFLLLLPILILYKFIMEWILSIEIPYNVHIGRGLTLHHGFCIVINKETVIGNNCTLRHNTTIGNRQNKDGSISKCPIIGNNVDIGAHVCIIGEITIGDNVKIGAGSIVVKSFPNNVTIVGNPAKIISSN